MRLAKQPRVVLDGVALGRGVDDGEHLLEVVEDEAVVEHRVLLGHAGHEGVLGQRVGPRRVLLVGAPDLLRQALHVGREEAVQVKEVTFGGAEGGAFIEVGVAEEVAALGFEGGLVAAW